MDEPPALLTLKPQKTNQCEFIKAGTKIQKIYTGDK